MNSLFLGGLFHDPDGLVSSKRVAGFVCLFLAAEAAIQGWEIAIFNRFLTLAGVLLTGGTLAEQIGKITMGKTR